MFPENGTSMHGMSWRQLTCESSSRQGRQRVTSQALLDYVICDYRSMGFSDVGFIILVVGDVDRPFKSSTKNNWRTM